MTCPRPTNIGANLVLTPDLDTYDVGQTIFFSCSAGFALSGSASITCGADGTFNTNVIPFCILGNVLKDNFFMYCKLLSSFATYNTIPQAQMKITSKLNTIYSNLFFSIKLYVLN